MVGGANGSPGARLLVYIPLSLAVPLLLVALEGVHPPEV